MAILVAVGGALLGNALGIGANVGWILGAVVGTLLFPPETATTKTEGPRLGDLTVTSSAYGAPRAVGFGTVRMGGNVIWANEIREEKRTRTVSSGGKGKGGKGGSEQKITEYYYYGTFTVAFGEGVARTVRRIWADGKLIYDVRGGTVRTQKKDHRFRIYTGTETQKRDPVHTAREGAGLTPAYRGTVMIVFDDIPLKDYGNRLPNITAEILYEGPLSRATNTTPVSEYTQIPNLTGFANTHYAIDWERQWFYGYYLTSDPASNGTGLFRVDMSTNTVDAWRHDEDILAPVADFSVGNVTPGTSTLYTSGPLHALANGQLVCMHTGTGTGNSIPIVLIDGATLTAVDTLGTNSSSLEHTPTKPYAWDQIASGRTLGTGEIHIALSGVLGGPPWIARVQNDTITYLWDNDTADFFTYSGSRNSSTSRGLTGEGFVDFWQARSFVGNSTEAYLYRYRSTEGAFFAEVDNGSGGTDPVFSGVDAGLWKTFIPTDIDANWTDFGQQTGAIYYDQADNTLLIIYWSGTGTAVPDQGYRMIKYDYTIDTILWISEKFNNAPINEFTSHSQARIQDTTIGWHISNREYQLNTQTGEFIENDDVGDFDRSEDGFGDGAYDSASQSFVSAYYDTDGQGYLRSFFGRYDSGGQALSTIVADVIERVGLVASDYAVADLASVTVPGYFIGRQTSARQAIEPLQNFFLFDGVESDFQLKFFVRGKAASRTITEDEFAISGDGDIYTENRIQEQELPELYSITYMDEAADYQQQHHIARRILNPVPAMNSRNKIGTQLNAVLTPSQAKQQAEKALYSAWIERSSFSYKLPWTHIDLDPSDVVNLEFDGGRVVENRISKMDVAEGLTLEMDSIGQKPSQFVDSGVEADGHQGFINQVVKDTDAIRGWVVDTPLLRDADADTERLTALVYYFQSGFADGFYAGGNVYVGFNTLDYSLAGELANETPWGTTLNALGDPVDGAVFQTDVTNTLTLVPAVGADQLSSITNTQLLNGENAILLIKRNGEVEVINFQNATTNADGTITIDTLLRGRRGTDTMAFNHTGGEVFLYLSNFTGDKFGLSLDFADGLTRVYFRHVGAGQLFQEGDNDIVISEARSLKPYAPTNYGAVVNGSDIDITWTRRTRYGGPLRDNYGTVPLNEDAEEYEIEILDGLDGAVVRTVTGITSPTYKYLSADITTDFGSIPVTLYLRIYQISAQVGRGFVADEYEQMVDVL